MDSSELKLADLPLIRVVEIVPYGSVVRWRETQDSMNFVTPNCTVGPQPEITLEHLASVAHEIQQTRAQIRMLGSDEIRLPFTRGELMAVRWSDDALHQPTRTVKANPLDAMKDSADTDPTDALARILKKAQRHL